ncbi:MAG: MarR family transcriptional regulator [Gemmatimonadetes bacterium]|nr:MarR family transcriptional regulator [Gemmatimonadota bacterium]
MVNTDASFSDSGGAEARAERLADRLHSASIHLLRRLRRQDDASGVTAPHLSALSVLVFGGARTLGELARAEQVRPPSMTRIIRNLERDGLVVREPHPHDRRSVRLRATDAGRRVLEEGRARRVHSLASRLRALSADELACLERAAALMEGIVRE